MKAGERETERDTDRQGQGGRRMATKLYPRDSTVSSVPFIHSNNLLKGGLTDI